MSWKPPLLRRRLLLATLAASPLRDVHRAALAVPPPSGSVTCLLPLVQQRLLLAECSAAITPGKQPSWSVLHALFTNAPFTDPKARQAVVGNLVRTAAAEYDNSLVYSRVLSADDRKLCFPRCDDECVRLQIDSDRMYRGLLVNEVLSALQAVEEELGYLSQCADDASRCPGEDFEEVRAMVRSANTAFDRFFDVVPAPDMQRAVQMTSLTSRRWELIPLDDGEGSGERRSRGGAPAMSLVGHDADEDATPAIDVAPTAATLVRFALPALAAWLISPLMSLVDTAVVGRGATAVSLAALGPATMIGDSASYLCSFLAVATTNLVAIAASNQEVAAAEGADTLAHTFGTAARLALLCGGVSTAVQVLAGHSVLSSYTAARSVACVAPAYEYVRIRALGAPAALLARVSIATCLATKDSLTPLLAVGFGGLLNLWLDVVKGSMSSKTRSPLFTRCMLLIYRFIARLMKSLHRSSCACWALVSEGLRGRRLSARWHARL